MTPEELARAIREPVLRDFPDIDVLVLHGSRARGDARANSDWDFGVLATPAAASDGTGPDLAGLTTLLVDILGTEAVDVADLGHTSALLRYRAARDGIALVERTPRAFERFRIEATIYWCDAGPVIRAAQARFLADLRTGRV